MRFSLPSIKCSAAPPSFRLLPSTVALTELCSTICIDYLALGSSRKLGGAAEHLIDGPRGNNALVGRALNLAVRMA